MSKLSEESAKKQYDNLLKAYNYDREPESKISTFQRDLEHYILKEVTGLEIFYSKTDSKDRNKPYKDRKVLEKGQLDWLYDHKIQIDRNGDQTNENFIPPKIISAIKDLKEWRNDTEHESNSNVTQIKYLSFIDTMAQTICLFSGMPIPDEIQKILNNQSFVNNKESPKEATRDSYEFINKEIFSKIEPNTSLYEALLIFLKELGIEHNTDISVYPRNIKTELKHMEQDILSIISEILESIKIKKKKSLTKFVIDDIKAAFKDIKTEGIILGTLPSHLRPAPCLKNLNYLEIVYENEYINIDEIKLNFKEKYNKMIRWQSLLDKVFLYKKLKSNK